MRKRPAFLAVLGVLGATSSPAFGLHCGANPSAPSHLSNGECGQYVEVVNASVPVSGPLTDAQLRAAAVPVSGPLTDAELRESSVRVSVDNLTRQERVPPDAVTLTNLTGTVAAIQDDPDAPDGTWLTFNSPASNTLMRADFPGPEGSPEGAQGVKVWLRAPVGEVPVTVTVFESVSSGGPVTPIATVIHPAVSPAGEMVALSFNAEQLANPSGSDLSVQTFSRIRAHEVGAVEWNSTVSRVGGGSPASSFSEEDSAVLKGTHQDMVHGFGVVAFAIGLTTVLMIPRWRR